VRVIQIFLKGGESNLLFI